MTAATGVLTLSMLIGTWSCHPTSYPSNKVVFVFSPNGHAKQIEAWNFRGHRIQQTLRFDYWFGRYGVIYKDSYGTITRHDVSVRNDVLEDNFAGWWHEGHLIAIPDPTNYKCIRVRK